MLLELDAHGAHQELAAAPGLRLGTSACGLLTPILSMELHRKNWGVEFQQLIRITVTFRILVLLAWPPDAVLISVQSNQASWFIVQPDLLKSETSSLRLLVGISFSPCFTSKESCKAISYPCNNSLLSFPKISTMQPKNLDDDSLHTSHQLSVHIGELLPLGF